jgi:hypothetical protein
MKIHRIGAIGAGLALVGGIAFVGVNSVGAAPLPPIDVSHDHVTCTSFYGTLKFKPGILLLEPVGGFTPTTATVKATLDGCVDSDNVNAKIAASKLSGTINYPSNDSGQLQGKKPATGSFTITWKTAPGAAKLTAATSTLNFTQLDTSIVNITTSGGPTGSDHNFSDGYGDFTLGTDAAHGATAAPTVTGDFAGTDSGHGSTFDGLSAGSVTALAGPSGVAAKPGLKSVTLGIGQMHIG